MFVVERTGDRFRGHATVLTFRVHRDRIIETLPAVMGKPIVRAPSRPSHAVQVSAFSPLTTWMSRFVYLSVFMP